MGRQWIVGAFLLALAVVMAPPAWADPCDNHMVLTSAKNAAGLPIASGTADAKVKAATLKSPAVNKFEVNLVASALHPYAVMVNSGTPTSPMTMVGGIFTDSAGAGDFDVTGATGTCSIHRVKVVDFLNLGKTILSGNFDNALGVDNDLPEVQVEIETEIQVEVQNELHNIANN